MKNQKLESRLLPQNMCVVSIQTVTWSAKKSKILGWLLAQKVLTETKISDLECSHLLILSCYICGSWKVLLYTQIYADTYQPQTCSRKYNRKNNVMHCKHIIARKK